MYGAPEFNHYHHDAAQLARYYKIPCYSTAGVGDASYPGIQATAEKMLTLSYMPLSGAQYIHYAFGLLDRTNIFCPEQAILDDAHIGIIKHNMAKTTVTSDRKDEVLDLIRGVLATDHKTYVYNLPLPTVDDVYMCYPLEYEMDDTLHAACDRRKEIMGKKRDTLPEAVLKDIRNQVKGILPRTSE
jgi:trimethylamine--corrinoid protein Co-methyltransferase